MTRFEGYFYIKSIANGYVITQDPSNLDPPAKLITCQQTFESPACHLQLWRWDGDFLVNKATEYVIDIYKGRLRVIEDTELVACFRKGENANNQRWGVEAARDQRNRPEEGSYLYLLANSDWVIDVKETGTDEGAKVIAYQRKPFDNDNQKWEFEPAEPEYPVGSMSPVNRLSGEFDESYAGWGDAIDRVVLTDDKMEEIRSKRRSNTSNGSVSSIMGGQGMPTMEFIKEAYQRAYLDHTPHLRLIAAAAAYHALQTWTLQLVEEIRVHPDPVHAKKELAEIAAVEAARVYELSDQLGTHLEKAQAMAGAIVHKLYEQQTGSVSQ
ncbi:hypothetical protein BC936DRAFT_144529 [Jimgerdemannia flammicorona]|uniref:Uncharacterized protein n=1 Tax=Jimgerdemannia flammicorona TaxID=994334 RepID=A0A433DCA3_9FUNG|nr:hypothetical protein BC936DRAFT_144529 [Jimgerdemannia flammicorona]